MDIPMNRFKRDITGAAPLYGAWLMGSSPTAAEALACTGFDFLVVDMEHTPIELFQAVEILRAMQGTACSPVTRIPWNDMVWVKRALDAGAQTLLFPFIQNADEARRAVAATRYPPGGVRGVAGVQRASRYGNVPGYPHKAADETCVIVQVETLDAFDQLTAIAAVPGVDSIFIGPSDLSAAMGHLGDISHPDVQAKLKEGAAMCKRLRKPCGIIGANPEAVQRFRDYGYTWLAVGSDVSMMVTRAQEWLKALR
jgi:4-hydroxy-2-oxoheptanedioate aldolase